MTIHEHPESFEVAAIAMLAICVLMFSMMELAGIQRIEVSLDNAEATIKRDIVALTSELRAGLESNQQPIEGAPIVARGGRLQAVSPYSTSH